MKDAGYSATELMNAGCSIGGLVALGYNAEWVIYACQAFVGFERFDMGGSAAERTHVITKEILREWLKRRGRLVWRSLKDILREWWRAQQFWVTHSPWLRARCCGTKWWKRREKNKCDYEDAALLEWKMCNFQELCRGRYQAPWIRDPRIRPTCERLDETTMQKASGDAAFRLRRLVYDHVEVAASLVPIQAHTRCMSIDLLNILLGIHTSNHSFVEPAQLEHEETQLLIDLGRKDLCRFGERRQQRLVSMSQQRLVSMRSMAFCDEVGAYCRRRSLTACGFW